MNKEPDPLTVRGAWYYIYGDGSYLNRTGRLLVCVPLFPVIVPIVAVVLLGAKLMNRGV